jgi:hypothetical protein
VHLRGLTRALSGHSSFTECYGFLNSKRRETYWFHKAFACDDNCHR